MIAKLLIRLAILAMPPARAEWLRAMINEIPSIPPRERSSFALGCLQVSLFERIKPMLVFPPLRIVPGLFAAALLTVLSIANGAKSLVADPVVGGVFLLVGLLWLGVLVAIQSQSARHLANLAVVGALFYGAVGALSLANAPAFVANATMLKALSVEGLSLFAVVFAVAQIPYFWSAAGKADGRHPPHSGNRSDQ
jgi:hypothetical protein